jgi:MFS family permease
MQLAAPDHLRGRIIGIYFYAFNGTASLAGFFVGWLCSVGGTELAFLIAGIVGLAGTLYSAVRLRGTIRLWSPASSRAAASS